MPIFTNKFDLPDYLTLWLAQDDYDYHEGVISATGLIEATRKHILKQRHINDIEIDFSDMISRKFGTAIHDSFEKVEMPSISKENRLFCEVDGRRISGKYDMLKNLGSKHMLIDIKTTGVWNWIYGSSAEHWKLQLSIYRYILKRNKYKVSQNAEICFVFTDWKRADSMKQQNYPPTRVGSNVIALYGVDIIEQYIKDRIKLIVDSEELSDDELPLCNEEELWKKKNKFAVMKDGRKKAIKIFVTEDEAKQYILNVDEEMLKHRIEIRKGYVDACNYCDVRSVCGQYKQLIANGDILGEEGEVSE